jgi:hypothetical protein
MTKPTIIIHDNSSELKQFLENKQIDYDIRFSDLENNEEHAKIISLQVEEKELSVKLEDGRILSIPIAWFKEWGVKEANSAKLTNYEIWGNDEIYFPDIDEVLGLEKFLYGFNADCK